MEQKCIVCNKVFKDSPSHIKRGRVSCSRACHNKRVKTGKPQSKESNLKRSKALRGNKCYAWKGGKTLHPSGYIMVLCRNHPYARLGGKYVREHRLVMEKHIGRYLKPSEIIHHIDGDIKNNHIDNLMLFPSHSAHASFHHPKGESFSQHKKG